ncbi:hypothetical protein [Bacillus cereus]|nr:hypothetical protein [Bacillus cereus]
METVLNNGSLPMEGIVPFNFTTGTDEKDFGKVNGNFGGEFNYKWVKVIS